LPAQLAGEDFLANSHWLFSPDCGNRRSVLTNDHEKYPTQGGALFMVTLRGPTWKHLWDSMVQLSERLEELGIGDEEADNV
jgi:hypothetical protein